MFKGLSICTACLLSAPLVAESIGDVEFQFPPSQFEWRLFAEAETLDQIIGCCDEDFADGDEGFCDQDFDDEDSEALFKIFTHREGDAFELLVAIQAQSDGEPEEEQSLAVAQANLDEKINQYLPNHRLLLLDWNIQPEEGFSRWELNDGQCGVMHGYSRFLNNHGTVTILCYLTSALPTEHNRILWTNTLHQAKVIQ